MKIRNFEENQTFSNIVTRIVTWGNLELEKINKKNSRISLCNPLVKANIPQKKLQNPSFRLFDILAYFGLIVHIATYFKEFDCISMRIF
jgi:hypothetical protein